MLEFTIINDHTIIMKGGERGITYGHLRFYHLSGFSTKQWVTDLCIAYATAKDIKDMSSMLRKLKIRYPNGLTKGATLD